MMQERQAPTAVTVSASRGGSPAIGGEVVIHILYQAARGVNFGASPAIEELRERVRFHDAEAARAAFELAQHGAAADRCRAALARLRAAQRGGRS